MARVRADDYEAKREAILDRAATLFAQDGYATATMAEIADRCGVSKSMLYHYFARKEDVLAAAIRGYGEFIMAGLDAVRASELPASAKLVAFVERYIDKPRRMKPRHALFLRETRFLPPRERRAVDEISRRVLRELGGVIAEVEGPLAAKPDLVALHARLLFGALNTIDVWYRGTGPLSPRMLAEEIVRHFLHGFEAPPAREEHTPPLSRGAAGRRPPMPRRPRAPGSGA